MIDVVCEKNAKSYKRHFSENEMLTHASTSDYQQNNKKRNNKININL